MCKIFRVEKSAKSIIVNGFMITTPAISGLRSIDTRIVNAKYYPLPTRSSIDFKITSALILSLHAWSLSHSFLRQRLQ